MPPSVSHSQYSNAEDNNVHQLVVLQQVFQSQSVVTVKYQFRDDIKNYILQW